MLRSKTRWQPVEAKEPLIRQLAEELEVHPLIARLLANRGLTEPQQARQFLQADGSDMYDPFLLDGMKEAVARIREALDRRERILIYGDYDADGVSSTSLMMMVFRRLGADVDYYIPNRFTEGYGFNEEALKQAKEAGVQLVISVDTGISAAAEAEVAKELGLDLIITDHHEPPEILPDAYAVINPKKPGCPYPFDMLAGVGVALKVAHALLGSLPEEVLDLAALGTIADLVPLLDENRIIASLGLERMNQQRNPGLTALMEASGVKPPVGAGHVGFSLGPRINASGRLESAGIAVELLLTEDREEAQSMAEELDRLNRERQQLVEEITREATAMVEADPDRYRRFILVAAPGWNVGVIGIVASRLVEKYYRPTIVLGIDEETGMAKGSARSIAGLDMYRALTECADLLPHFGGHEMAAGMSLPRENLLKLHRRLDQIAGDWLQEEDYIPLSRVEADLTIGDVDVDLIQELERLAPYGVGNPTPQFRITGAGLSRMQLIGREKNHLKLTLKDGDRVLEAVGFRLGELAEEIAPSAAPELLGELSINEWNNRRIPQLIIRDIAVPHLQVFDWRSNRDKSDQFRRLAAQSGSVFVFRKEPRAANWLSTSRVLLWGKIEEMSSLPPVHQLVLVDLPPSVEAFNRLLQKCSDVKRVYFAFGDAELDGSLARTPDREQFKRLYAYLLRKKQYQVPSELKGLSRRTGLSPRGVAFMLRVFDELGFVHLTDHQLDVVPQPAKRPLSESHLYCQQQEREQVQHAFVYSSYRELCQRTVSVISGDPK
ncbi:MAG: single-stranded-DNA-specific exonuclease RecJ [Firmicutes bacterium]|nr:single-stranded-DNA-specific exonuclease RecJ [Bacillota bacterium]